MIVGWTLCAQTTTLGWQRLHTSSALHYNYMFIALEGSVIKMKSQYINQSDTITLHGKNYSP